MGCQLQTYLYWTPATLAAKIYIGHFCLISYIFIKYSLNDKKKRRKKQIHLNKEIDKFCQDIYS